MKHLIIAGLIALLALSSCEWILSDCDCDPAEVICGEPLGSVVTKTYDDTVTICDLPRTYFLSFYNPEEVRRYDSLEWEFPEEAYDIEYRLDIQAVNFKVIEGTHTLRCRGHSLESLGADWSEWGEWTWTLTLEE